jgi:acetyltransferase-like isoleucine patch superfamily enzyme
MKPLLLIGCGGHARSLIELIEHDVQIGHHCHVSTGVLINEGVQIGSDSFIGSGAMIREGLNLPPLKVIGAGKRVMGWPLRDQ